MYELLAKNITAVFALGGVLLGSMFTFFANSRLKEKELQLRLREKVLDRRIEAHEAIFKLVAPMRHMRSLEYQESESELARTPQFFMSPEEFYSWHIQHREVAATYSAWLTKPVSRELNFIQDYTLNLSMLIEPAPADLFPEIGRIIRSDFIDMAHQLEKIAFDFFEKDLSKMTFGDPDEHHKYKKDETLERLNLTELYQEWATIAEMIQSNTESSMTK